MEDENREPNTCRLTGEGTELTVSISGSGVVTPVPSVTKPTNVLPGQVIPQAHSSLTNSTVTSVTGAPVLPTGAVYQPIQPYNSSLMYEDNRLPAYVDYLGSILPILDWQSVTNWPGTPHPLTGQVWIMPYNAANLPTVQYILNIGIEDFYQSLSGASQLYWRLLPQHPMGPCLPQYLIQFVVDPQVQWTEHYLL